MHTLKNRRRFLSSALATTGAATLTAISPSEAQSPASNPTTDLLYDSSLAATTLTGEAADRLAIRRLIDAWAYCADRRLAERQTALFTPEASILNYLGNPATTKPVSTLTGHAVILKALAVLNQFTHTTHFMGQSDVLLHGDHATGESYCLAHQITEADGKRTLQVLSIRYRDNYVRRDNRWLFAQRILIIDWSDTRPSTA